MGLSGRDFQSQKLLSSPEYEFCSGWGGIQGRTPVGTSLPTLSISFVTSPGNAPNLSVQLTRIPLGTNWALGPNLPLGPDRKSNERMETLHKQGLPQSFTANEGITLVLFSSLLKTACWVLEVLLGTGQRAKEK